MNNEDTLKISQQRDEIYVWVTNRFKQLMAEERVDDALILADEFFEWLDPNQLESEETLFSDYGLGQLSD
jgi:putative SOS response-associated peptidase YedK|tara:strand:- start:2493 stop:2702 length:210 start_codon:yes stop_codon:yes gene_type:complete